MNNAQNNQGQIVYRSEFHQQWHDRLKGIFNSDAEVHVNCKPYTNVSCVFDFWIDEYRIGIMTISKNDAIRDDMIDGYKEKHKGLIVLKEGDELGIIDSLVTLSSRIAKTDDSYRNCYTDYQRHIINYISDLFYGFKVKHSLLGSNLIEISELDIGFYVDNSLSNGLDANKHEISMMCLHRASLERNKVVLLNKYDDFNEVANKILQTVAYGNKSSTPFIQEQVKDLDGTKSGFTLNKLQNILKYVSNVIPKYEVASNQENFKVDYYLPQMNVGFKFVDVDEIKKLQQEKQIDAITARQEFILNLEKYPKLFEESCGGKLFVMWEHCDDHMLILSEIIRHSLGLERRTDVPYETIKDRIAKEQNEASK